MPFHYNHDTYQPEFRLAGLPVDSPSLALLMSAWPRRCAPAGACFAPRDTRVMHGPEHHVLHADGSTLCVFLPAWPQR
jgi:hypothetical protein